MNHTYKTSDLAKAYHIHPNTIRLYESWGLIRKADRTTSNYRVFTDVQYIQTGICRCLIGHPFTTKRIRLTGNQLIHAAYEWDIPLCQQYYDQYIQTINEEIYTANETAKVLKIWVDKNTTDNTSNTYSRKDAANLLHTTTETIRNWERNNLIHPCKIGQKKEVLFSQRELERMHIIYMLLQAGYSLFAIHQSLSKYDHGEKDKVIEALNEPGTEDDLMLVGDRWLLSLEKVKEASSPLPLLISQMQEVYFDESII